MLTRVIKRFEPFVLGVCKCGCSQEISIRSSNKIIQKFKNHHNIKDKYHPMWKGGKTIDSISGYVWIKKRNHSTSMKNGYIQEHRLIYEEYYKYCLLPWIVIHHKNFIKDDNRIENLQALTKGEHTMIHKIKDHENTRCIYPSCSNPTKTKVEKSGYPHWYYYEDGYICSKCYQKRRKVNKLQYL